jgi:hypothetical protein
MRSCLLFGVLAAAASCVAGCRDTQGFSTSGDRYEGSVVQGDFVRAGVAGDVRLCMTLDTDHLQDAPGRISTTDGRFASTPMRPVPQIWHDPLSTLSFGEGRVKNLVYVAAGSPADASAVDVNVVVSLMASGGVEVRLVRGAPGGPDDANNLFAVFDLERKEGPCSY